MSNLLGNVTGNELLVIKDPFNKDGIHEMFIHYTSWMDKKYWWAQAKFKNGNTEGLQKTPDCDTFDEVIAHVKTILNSVENK